MTGWYDFSDVKSSKMLSFNSVAEAHGLIYPREKSYETLVPRVSSWSKKVSVPRVHTAALTES